jgi:ribonucleoside-triphosphate reductase (thioredoxin)
LAKDVSSLLGMYGINSSIANRAGTSSWGKPFEAYVVSVIGGQPARERFAHLFPLIHKQKQEALLDSLSVRSKHYNHDQEMSRYAEVISVIEDVDRADVWDISVYDDTHAFQIDHCVTGNCGEINLRGFQFCNLTEVVVKEHDNVQTLTRKVELATILGTWQSTLTNFKYIRKVWRDNTEEERLLGVSLTGQLGNTLMSGAEGSEALENALSTLKSVAIATNEIEAGRLGIQVSSAITTVKPSGTVSQLAGVSSGMHPWHSEYYIRTIRADNKDPLTQFLKDSGVYNEPDVMRPTSTTVFYFPQKAPAGAVTRRDLSAKDHLEIWRSYKKAWTEHNPSITVSVAEDEWLGVADWVYSNWDDVGGISFLPQDDHVYQQAPYQELTAAEYNEWVAKTPASINWESLSFYELEDTTTGSQSLSCVAGACDVADLIADENVVQ